MVIFLSFNLKKINRILLNKYALITDVHNSTQYKIATDP